MRRALGRRPARGRSPGTQTPFNLREELARIFGLAPDRVRVVVPPMGGSFGAKTFLRTEAIAAALARKAGRPVKLVLPRAEEWQTLNRHAAVVTMKLGALADGTLLALETTCLADTGAYADCGPGVAQKMGFAAPGPYRIPNVRVDARCVYTNLPPAGAFRGYGQMQSAWARERAVDLLAERLGLDPLELRLRNLLRDGDVYCTGETMHDVHFAECLEAAADAIGWHEGRAGEGPERDPQGNADAEPGVDPHRARRRRGLHAALRDHRDGAGGAPGDHACWPPSCSRSSRS